MKLMATTLQALIKDTPKENGEKPHNKQWEDDGKGERGNKKKKEK